GDVLAGLQRREALRGVVGDGRVDVDGVDVGIFQQVVEAGVADLDAEAVAALVEGLLVAAADGDPFGGGGLLVAGDELGAEAEADDGDADLVAGRHGLVPSPGFGTPNAERGAAGQSALRVPR